MPRSLPTRAELREQFPLHTGPDVLLDHAGGSPVPRSVLARVEEYFTRSYVQLGADYATSRRATAIVEKARDLARAVVGAEGLGEVVLGSSTSSLCAMLAEAYARRRHAGAAGSERNRIVLAELGHEANLGPWARLEEQGFEVVTWHVDPRSGAADLAQLEALVDERTLLVAAVHVSNLQGRVEDVAGVSRIAHAAGARVIADGVAFAPHRSIDVAALGVDWYVFSTYKVYGPHMAVLFGTHDAFSELTGPNHYFVPEDEVPYRWELGGPNHESCAAWLGTWDYLRLVAGETPEPERALQDLDPRRDVVLRAFARIAELEAPLAAPLLAWIDSCEEARLIGPAADEDRVPTVSFVHATRPSRELALAANERGFGVRYGHFYAHRLALALGLEPEDGVVRTSLLHTTTEDEVAALLGVLDEVTAR